MKEQLKRTIEPSVSRMRIVRSIKSHKDGYVDEYVKRKRERSKKRNKKY